MPGLGPRSRECLVVSDDPPWAEVKRIVFRPSSQKAENAPFGFSSAPAYNNNVAADADKQREALQAFIVRYEIVPTAWEKEAGIGDGTLTKFLARKTESVTTKTLMRLAAAFAEKRGEPIEWTDLVSSTESDPHASTHITAVEMSVDATLPQIPLWRSSPGAGTDEFGGWIVSLAEAGTAPRPETLRYTQLANGFRVLDRKNEPVYAYKDTILIDRDLPADPGEDCVVMAEPAEGKPVRVILGKLIRETLKLWIIVQYAVPGELEIPKDLFPSAWPVVARYHHR